MYLTRIHPLPSFLWFTKDKIDLFCGQGQLLAFSPKCATQEITPKGPGDEDPRRPFMSLEMAPPCWVILSLWD